MTPSGPENIPAELLAKLMAAGADGLKKTPLLGRGKKVQAAKLAELDALVAREEVVRLGTEKTPVFVLRRFYRPLEMACAAVEAKAVPGAPKLFNEKELAAGLAKHVKEKAAEAIRLLVSEKKLLRVQRAKSVYYLHASAVLPLVETHAKLPPPPPPHEAEVSWENVRRAYEAVVRESGFSDVLIVDLQRAAALPLGSLKSFLLTQSRAGRVAPSRGDWSLADDAARTAALELGGEPYLRVRLL